MAARSKKDLERVEDAPKDRAYFENHIAEAVRAFYYENFNAETTEQIAKCSQNSFISALQYARRCCIQREDLLDYIPHKITEYNTVLNEAYSPEKVGLVCECFLSLCFLYDKVPSIYAFAVLTGIERGTLQEWVEREKVRLQRREHTPKKSILDIKAAREQSLSNLALSGGKPAIGAIAHLNNELWKESIPEQPKQGQGVTVEELPVFDPVGGLLEQGERVALPVSDDALGLPVLGGL